MAGTTNKCPRRGGDGKCLLVAEIQLKFLEGEVFIKYASISICSPSKTLIATTLSSLVSTLSSLGLKNTSTLGNSIKTPL